ncbi:MAG: uroporphyrinogen-III C-methyltransferase [Hyphomicrobiaceae bacterium]|nr:MAG: uroporphyrinogen-III C-methyltransferase [Hyphomicrobiaceae bacterium]
MQGRVYLVGAGPGDPDLLTLKALKAIEAADVVVYDRLVSREVLALIPSGAARIDVGKRPRAHPVPQEEINRILVAVARSGRVVVRLKGGDPFLFGRGGEEALALAAAGIAFEVVPGITSAQGCAAQLKFPLTHRGIAEGVRYVTGHCRADQGLDFDWEGLADHRTTLVVYMGLASIAEIARELIRHGRASNTPVLAVSRGTTPEECHLTSTLAAVAADVATARLASPTLFVIGEVVRVANSLGCSCHVEERHELAAGT